MLGRAVVRLRARQVSLYEDAELHARSSCDGTSRAAAWPGIVGRGRHTLPGHADRRANERPRTRDADGPMACFQAEPQGEPRGAVLVIQEAFGVNAHIRDVTTRFADAGFHAVAPAFFHRAGGGAVEDYTDFSAIFPLF